MLVILDELEIVDICHHVMSLGVQVLVTGTVAVTVIDKSALLASDVGTSQRALERLFRRTELASFLEATFTILGGFRGRLS